MGRRTNRDHNYSVNLVLRMPARIPHFFLVEFIVNQISAYLVRGEVLRIILIQMMNKGVLIASWLQVDAQMASLISVSKFTYRSR